MSIANLHTPRWVIFLIDLLISAFSLIVAYQLRFNFSIPLSEMHHLPKVLLFALSVRAVSFLIAKTNASIWRYSSTQDATRIFFATVSGSLIFIIANILNFYYINHTFIIPFSIVIIDNLVTTFSMTALRMIVKIAYLELY